MRIAVLCGLLACGSPAAPQAPSAASPELSPALEPLAWWLGDWQAADGSREHWTAANGAIYGVALGKDSFEVLIIDDGDGTGPADGILRLLAMPGGTRSVEFRAESLAVNQATFANPQHDDPTSITYARIGDTLRAELTGTQALTFTFDAIPHVAAPEIEAADRAFAADTKARGVDGWMAAFDVGGGMLRGGERITGDAIRATMGPLLAGGTLAWDPIASGRAGTLGYTVGEATYTAAEPSQNFASTYVTIWKQHSDGSWRVFFDVGRPVNAR